MPWKVCIQETKLEVVDDFLVNHCGVPLLLVLLLTLQ